MPGINKDPNKSFRVLHADRYKEINWIKVEERGLSKEHIAIIGEGSGFELPFKCSVCGYEYDSCPSHVRKNATCRECSRKIIGQKTPY